MNDLAKGMDGSRSSLRVREKRARGGGRRSRPSKSAQSVAALIESLLAERVTKADGSRSRLTALQAIVLHLMSKSAAGDRRATKTLMRYRQRDREVKDLAITVIGGLPD